MESHYLQFEKITCMVGHVSGVVLMVDPPHKPMWFFRVMRKIHVKWKSVLHII